MPGKAINLVYVDNDGKMRVSDEAVHCLKGIKNDISVVSVLGRFRGGKSSLLARLIGQKSFEVSSSVQACTKGIRLYDTPLDTRAGHKVLILDTEGLMATDSDTNHDTRVFAMGILLSSAFVYNISGTIDETTLSTLRVVIQFASMMLSEEDCEGDSRPMNYEELSQHMPEFNVLVRDFALTLEDSSGAKMTPTQWLESALSIDEVEARPNRLENSDDKIEIRRAIKELFQSRRCFTLPRPTSNEDVLAHMDTASDADLKPEFVKGVQDLRKHLIENAPPKRILGEPVTGEGLLAITRQLVDRINSGAAPRIRDSWALLSELRARDAAEKAMNHMRQVTSKWGHADMPLADLKRALQKVATETVKLYKKAYPEQGSVEIARKLEEESIPERVEEVMDAALKRLTAHIDAHIESTQSELTGLEASILHTLESSDLTVICDQWGQMTSCVTQSVQKMEKLTVDLQGHDDSRSWQRRSDLFEKICNVMESILTAVCTAIDENSAMCSSHRIKDLETLLKETEESEKESIRKMDQLRTESEAEMSRYVSEVRESRSSEREEFQAQLKKLREDQTDSLTRFASLQSENDSLKKDLEMSQSSMTMMMQQQQPEEEDTGQLDALNGKLDDMRCRAERAERESASLREESSARQLEMQTCLDEARKHTEKVIAEHEECANRRVSESEQAQREAEASVEQSKKTLEKLQQESQKMVSSLKARLETCQHDVDDKRRQIEELKRCERETRREEHQSMFVMQEQLSEARRNHQAEMDKRESKLQTELAKQRDEAVDLERRIAHLSGINENGKRDSARLAEVVQDNKRLKHDKNELQNRLIKNENKLSISEDRLFNTQKMLDAKSEEVVSKESENKKLNQQLGIAQFMNNTGHLQS